MRTKYYLVIENIQDGSFQVSEQNSAEPGILAVSKKFTVYNGQSIDENTIDIGDFKIILNNDTWKLE